jgi:hypothetical protein
MVAGLLKPGILHLQLPCSSGKLRSVTRKCNPSATYLVEHEFSQHDRSLLILRVVFQQLYTLRQKTARFLSALKPLQAEKI